MNAKTILKGAERFIVHNSPGILTGIGVAGTVTTAVLAGKAAYSAALQITERELQTSLASEMPDRKQKVQMVWKEFIPAGAVGLATIVAIVGANQIGTRRAAAIAAAYTLSEQMTDDYKKKVLETLGIQKEEKMRSELAGEKMAKNPPDKSLLVVGGSNVLFFDEMTGRYFHNTMEKVQQAVNEINHQVNNYFHASLSDFYWKIGLTPTSFSDKVGWNSDELLDVQYSAVMYEGVPAIMIGYNNEPISGYDRVQ